jgi:hypothetical protein
MHQTVSQVFNQAYRFASTYRTTVLQTPDTLTRLLLLTQAEQHDKPQLPKKSINASNWPHAHPSIPQLKWGIYLPMAEVPRWSQVVAVARARRLGWGRGSRRGARLSAIGPGSEEALAGGRMAWRRRWSLAPARTPLGCRRARQLSVSHLNTPVQRPQSRLNRWGRRTGRAGQRTVKTTTRKIMCEPGNTLVWRVQMGAIDKCISVKWNIQQKLILCF